MPVLVGHDGTRSPNRWTTQHLPEAPESIMAAAGLFLSLEIQNNIMK
jgi:hypothetical protein